jgi:hypothetical protein
MKPAMKKTANFPFEIKTISETGAFSGYASVFGNEDLWGDIVVAGAFSKSIAEKKPAMLWQHNSDEPIGVWVVLAEDEKGLYVEGQLLINGVARAKEAYELLVAKAISGMSIGYVPVVWEWQKKEDSRNEIRLLKEVDLWEISLVTFPANTEARVGDVKDLNTLRDIEGFLRDAGCSRNEAKGIIAQIRDVQRDADNDENEEKKAIREALMSLKITIGGN